MTWFRASGAMVATYWSVFVTVLMAQTEITETGMSSDARMTSTHATIPLVRGARWLEGPSAADSVTSEVALGVESQPGPDEIPPILPYLRG